MNKKIIFLDLDGTLLNDEKQVTPGNRDAIDRMLAAGHYVVINTGRHTLSARIQAERIGLAHPGCYLVAFNGGVLYDFSKEASIYEAPIPLEDARLLFHEANKRKLHIQAFDDKYVLIEAHNDTEYIQEYCAMTLLDYRVIPNADAIVEEPLKLLAIDKTKDHQKGNSYRDWINTEHGDRLEAFFSNDSYMEIIKKGVSKSSGLLQLIDILGVPLENTIACGDAYNDLAMIETAHVGVAMCNGTDEVKAAANYITERDNNHDGIAEVIDKFVFGK